MYSSLLTTNIMLISDLPYLEEISTKDLIFGAALLALNAFALATGVNSLANASTSVFLRTIGKITIGIGRGTASAVGNNPIASVNAYSSGFDIVLTRTVSRTSSNYASKTVNVIAIDLPFV